MADDLPRPMQELLLKHPDDRGNDSDATSDRDGRDRYSRNCKIDATESPDTAPPGTRKRKVRGRESQTRVDKDCKQHSGQESHTDSSGAQRGPDYSEPRSERDLVALAECAVLKLLEHYKKTVEHQAKNIEHYKRKLEHLTFENSILKKEIKRLTAETETFGRLAQPAK